MMNLKSYNFFLVTICLSCLFIESFAIVELTFELEDKARECFYENITKGEKVSTEYQVIKGGNSDVDCYIEDPDGLKLYTDQRKQYDVHEWTAQKSGEYSFCFSNEFSTITHKVVYFQLAVGDEKPLLDSMNKPTALGQIETSCVMMHEQANNIIGLQTHFRLREASGRTFAESLSYRVQIWSAVQLIVMVVVMTTQIIIVKSFFSSTKTNTRITT